MRSSWIRAVATAAAMTAAGTASAVWHASDLIYLPAVAHTTGAEGSQWRTDIYLTNVDSVDIDVMMVYLPSGFQNNAPLLNDRAQWLGGRESDGVGFVDERLADIPPNGSVRLDDVVGEHWVDSLGLSGNGAMIVFAHEAGSLDSDGNRVFRNAVVHARIYNQTQIWEQDPDDDSVFTEVDTTYGQVIPGVPWYDLGDPSVVDAVDDEYDFSFMVLVGGQENENFRYNLGFLNASDPQTQLQVEVKPFRPDGTEFMTDGDDPAPRRIVVTVPPLNHIQYFQILSNVIGIDEDVTNVMVRVRVTGWETTAVDPLPAFTTYGSVIDNVSNDPTTIVPSFRQPYDVDCVWAPDAPDDPAKSSGAPARRPVEIPSMR